MKLIKPLYYGDVKPLSVPPNSCSLELFAFGEKDKEIRYMEFHMSSLPDDVFSYCNDNTKGKDHKLNVILRHLDIKPYTWMLTDLKNAVNTNDDTITNMHVMFWDIETYSENGCFTDASKLEDYIFMISIITKNDTLVSKYILVFGDCDPLEDHTINLLKFNTEKDLILGFFDVWIQFQPDVHVTYNGNQFDIKYITKRCQLLSIDIPNLCKKSSIDKRKRKTRSVCGIERKGSGITFSNTSSGSNIKNFSINHEFKTIGVVNFDMLNYFRSFYPLLPNYKLNTVSRSLINEGKVDMDISKVFGYVREKDATFMAKIALYSIQDSNLLMKLWDKLNVYNETEKCCNTIGCSIEYFLESPFIDMVPLFFDPLVTVDPIISDNKKSLISYRIPAPGVYKGVKVYSYANILLRILAEYDLYLSEKMKCLPLKLIILIIGSYYIPNSIKLEIHKKINDILSDGDIFGVSDSYIMTFEDFPEGELLTKFDLLIQIDEKNFILYNGEILKFGYGRIIVTDFQLLENVICEYIDILMEKKNKGLKIEMKHEYLILESKICSYSKYHHDVTGELYDILESKGINVKTWINVKYYQTLKGPILLEDYNGEELDKEYYAQRIKELYSFLIKLPVHIRNAKPLVKEKSPRMINRLLHK